jgi:hypothetical protein
VGDGEGLDRLLFGLLEPVVARDLPVVLVGAPVAVLPREVLALGDAEPLDEA